MPHTETLHPLRQDLAKRISEAGGKDYVARRASLKEFLVALNRTWWASHAQNPQAYPQEIAAINAAANWHNECAQQAAIGEKLLPPKFFSAALDTLEENYVLSVSLNHKFQALQGAFVNEVADFQTEASHTDHCLSYFGKEYAYARFFLPRGKVLKAYRDVEDAPKVAWRQINQRFAAYVEAFPTWSQNSSTPGNDFDASNFLVCSLNQLTHEAFLGLLPPGVILAAGADAVAGTHRVLHELQFVAGAERDVTNDVLDPVKRPGRDRGPVKVQVFARGALSLRVVSSHFLKTITGPNSDEELRRLGNLLRS